MAEHPLVTHVSDFTNEHDTPDFTFRYERDLVRLEVKLKQRPLSQEIRDLWPEADERNLFVVDEVSLRKLVWAEGLGYLLLRDRPGRRWCSFGPWELWLGPRRRYERRVDRGNGEFLKGKLLVDLRAAAVTTEELDLDALLGVVRSSRAAVDRVSALPLRVEGTLPVIPRLRPAPPPGHESPSSPLPPAPRQEGEKHPDATWAGLSPELVRRVKAAWHWERPTAVQALSFPPVLAGRNVLILGPTAGGKTEAALLPLLDSWHEQGWSSGRPSVLVVNPLKALLDDQLERWRRATALVGATAFAWHGDVGSEARAAFKDAPSDVLLTTPESLENLLASPAQDEERLFGGLRAVVVDEVHAFAGTPRGAQLASLLERLDRFVEAPLQRVGLSATVGDPDRVLAWLSGGSLLQRTAVDAGPPMLGEQVAIRTFTTLDDATDVIASSIAGERSLVFTRSRRRAEELAHGLRLPPYHSSMAAEPRREALRQLRTGEVHAVVATGSLEMGIDVGDLDLVVHDGAPATPASYLQRLGRAGRRSGQRRLVFTTGEADDLLIILAVLLRARRGDVGKMDPQRGARLVLGQQALSLTMQQLAADRQELRNTLRWSTVFSSLDTEIDATLEHLTNAGFLQDASGTVVLGREGLRRFGGPRGLGSLLATFSGSGGATVLGPGDAPIGRIDWQQAEVGRQLLLAGRAWRVISIDRSAGHVLVEATGHGRALSWRGPSLEVERPTWEAVREILAGTDVPVAVDERGLRWLEAERRAWAPRLAAPVRATGTGTAVDTFAGERVHRAVLAILEVDGKVEGTGFTAAVGPRELASRSRAVLADPEPALQEQARREAPSLVVANPDLIPPSVLLAEVRAFELDEPGIRSVLTLLAEWPS
ncbi:MAG: DEAD/DEAH box helicase [Acidimicrobiales bacterium]